MENLAARTLTDSEVYLYCYAFLDSSASLRLHDLSASSHAAYDLSCPTGSREPNDFRTNVILSAACVLTWTVRIHPHVSL